LICFAFIVDPVGSQINRNFRTLRRAAFASSIQPDCRANYRFISRCVLRVIADGFSFGEVTTTFVSATVCALRFCHSNKTFATPRYSFRTLSYIYCGFIAKKFLSLKYKSFCDTA
jgi:hypothetical protein